MVILAFDKKAKVWYNKIEIIKFLGVRDEFECVRERLYNGDFY
jgi:hypothetical protein